MEEGYFEVDLDGNFTFFNDSVSPKKKWWACTTSSTWIQIMPEKY
jgi:hypothetical protein